MYQQILGNIALTALVCFMLTIIVWLVYLMVAFLYFQTTTWLHERKVANKRADRFYNE